MNALFEILKQFNPNAGMKSPYQPGTAPTGRPYPSYVDESEYAEGMVKGYQEPRDPNIYMDGPSTAAPMTPTPKGLLGEQTPNISPYGEKEFTKNYGDTDPDEVKRLRQLYGI